MDTFSLTKVKSLFILTLIQRDDGVKSLFILTLIQRDDGQKKQTLETPTNGACV